MAKGFIRSFKHFFSLIILPFHCEVARSMVQELGSYIKKGDKVLDLGCGTGVVGFALSERLQANVVGCDIRDVREFNIPFVLYDGSKLPFPDRSFNVVLIAYVLHHVPNAEAILKEVKRVANRYIVIYEDTPKNIFHHLSCFIHGLSFNRAFLGHQGFKFMSRQEWRDIFNNLGLRIISEKDVDALNPIYFTDRACFILDVPPQ